MSTKVFTLTFIINAENEETAQEKALDIFEVVHDFLREYKFNFPEGCTASVIEVDNFLES